MEYSRWVVGAWTGGQGHRLQCTNNDREDPRYLTLGFLAQEHLCIAICGMTCILLMASCGRDSQEMAEPHTKTTLSSHTEAGVARKGKAMDLSTCNPYEPGGHHMVTSFLVFYKNTSIPSSCRFDSHVPGLRTEPMNEFCAKMRHRLGAIQVAIRGYRNYTIDNRNHKSTERVLLKLIDECLEAETLTARLYVDIFFMDAANRAKTVDPWGNEPAREEVYSGLFRLQWAGKDKELDTCDDIFAGVELRYGLMDVQWSCIEDSIKEVGSSLQLPPEEEIVIDNQAGGTISIHITECFAYLSLNKGDFGLPFWGGEISIDRCTQPDGGEPKRDVPEPPTVPPVPGP